MGEGGKEGEMTGVGLSGDREEGIVHVWLAVHLGLTSSALPPVYLCLRHGATD